MKPYFKEVIKREKPTLVVFLHAAGQDAVDVKYILEDLNKKYGDKVELQRVDVSYNHHLNTEYKLSKYPAWVLFKQGEELMRETGTKTLGQIDELVQRAF